MFLFTLLVIVYTFGLTKSAFWGVYFARLKQIQELLSRWLRAFGLGKQNRTLGSFF